VLLILSISVLAAGVFAGGTLSTVAMLGTAELCGYAAIGFLTSGLPPKVYLSIFYAPPYILWKSWLFACQLTKKAGPAWLPTSRDS